MIRQCTTADTAKLYQLEQQCFGAHGWNKDMLQSEINNTYCTLLAYTNTEGDIVGYLSARIVGDTVEIGNIAVSSSCRRQGVARQLLGALADMYKGECQCIMLEVAVGNAGAVALYHSCGYTTVTTRRNFYEGGRYGSRDAYTMQYTLL